MGATLYVTVDGQERCIVCTDLVTVGRHASNDIALPDERISRSHALIRHLGDGQYYLMDTGSANGTFVNDQRVLVPRMLADGDSIRVGRHTLAFHWTETVVPPVRTEPNDDDEPTLCTMGGVLQKVTILVADIRNYTRMSEQIPAKQIAQIVGDWFRSANGPGRADGRHG